MDPIRSIKLRWFNGTLADISVTRVQLWHAAPHTWQPPINAFRCARGIRICVDLAGIDKSEIDLQVEPRRVVVRGSRPAPEPTSEQPVQMLALEIDYGPFERAVDLPIEVDVDEASAEQQNGLLWISLPAKK
jgi:HSP20 family molecular chaperone IbpA